jgi:hypothetical protein
MLKDKSASLMSFMKLLQMRVDDYRKFAVWRILAPYLINIRKYSTVEASGTIKDWPDRCSPSGIDRALHQVQRSWDT